MVCVGSLVCEGVAYAKRQHTLRNVDLSRKASSWKCVPRHWSAIEQQSTNGDNFQPAWAPPTIPWNDSSGAHTGFFAFWSIAGGANGGVVDFNTLPQGVPVGSTDIVATAIYIEGGGGNGEPGAWIDAFDVNQGIFVDDDFVNVSPDASLTAAANNDGWVPSASAENVLAYSSIHAVPFSEWHVFVGTETVSNTTLNIAAQIFGRGICILQDARFQRTTEDRQKVCSADLGIVWGDG